MPTRCVSCLIGEGGAAAVFSGFAQAEFSVAADIQFARLSEGLKQAVEEDLGLALFVAGDVVLNPGGELRKLFLARHGRTLQERGRMCRVKPLQLHLNRSGGQTRLV